MKSCLTLAAFCVAVALLLASYSWMLVQSDPATAARRAAEAAWQEHVYKLDVQERERRAAQWADLSATVMPAAKVAGVLLILLVPVALALAGVELRRELRHRRETVRIDSHGLLPVPRSRWEQGAYDGHALAAVGGYHSAQMEAARNPALPPAPEGVRSVRYDVRPAAPRLATPTETTAPTLAPPAPVLVPSFGALLAGGILGGDERRLLMGYDVDGGKLWSKGLGSLFSFGLAGLQGTGKTTTTRFVLAQAALQGARLVIIDPHRDTAGEESLAGTLAPLRPAFAIEPAADDDEIREALRLIHAEIDAREHGARGPILIWAVDEWTDLGRRRVADELRDTARRVSTVGRKLGVYAAISGQGWTKESAGEVRDYLTAAYVHKLRPPVARLLAPGIPSDVWTLEPGQAYLDQTTGGRHLVRIPDTTAADLGQVARLLPPPAPLVGERTDERVDEPQECDLEASTERIMPFRPPARPPARVSLLAKAEAAALPLTEDERGILQRLDKGETPAAIAKADTGSAVADGRPYRRRRGEVERLQQLVEGWPEGQVWADDDAHSEEG